MASLQSNERLPAAQLDILQEQLLRSTLESARRRIPAYRALRLPERNLRRHLQELPIISKNDLLTRRREFYPVPGLERAWSIKGMTSGTTGTPLKILRSLDSVIWENAFLQRHWAWSGYKPGMRRATLRGDAIAPVEQTSPPFWFFNRADNQLLLSSRHLRPPYIDQIISRIRAFRPHLLQAYPSTAFELASYVQRKGERLDIPFVYTGSEMLYPYQREVISSALNTRIMDFYGMAERVAFATECEYGRYHVNSEYSYVEIVDDTGQATRDEGYVVGTTFHNHTMPLVRYRLSDRSRWLDGACPCGRTYPLIEPVAGKFEDVVLGSAGHPISPSIVTFAFKGLQHIEKSQVAQVGDGVWEIRVVSGPGFTAEDRAALVNNIHAMVDPGLAVRIVERADIPRTASGKYRWVINEWKSNPYGEINR
ncbi:MAG: phenylacetate--CoA ligase family protein [Betaproteobacteria bacterium]|nr:phenylacetate--CoA ligase family protein [Betaproteobacteria bacterium]